MKFRKIFSTILFALMPLIGVADIMRDLHEARYDIYYADINSVEFGLDGYPDIYLAARDDFIPIGVGNSFMVSLLSGYQDKMFCGQPSGDFVDCSIGFGALLPDEKTSAFDFLIGDFNGDGIIDGLLHSQDQNTNSIYLEHDGNGDVEIISQFTEVGGYYVSGDNISITNELGSSASEINFDGAHYSEFNGEEFGKVRGGPLVADVTGATPGTMNVSMGVLQYSIPVSLPKGPAGINPTFSINYASQSSYGHLGAGFRISGLSSIERCPADFHRDGVVRGVSGEGMDRACLDGNRLVLVSGEYWGENSEYRLESETFSRITYADNAFTVEQKNGDVYKYGGSQEYRFQGGEAVSGAISRWALEWVGDRLGFGYRITYEDGTGGMLPAAISYTVEESEPASSAELVVDFSYESDPYQLTSALFGKKYALGKRLLNITLRSNGSKIRAWYFNYSVNGLTGRSLLDEYQECGIDETCLAPTKMEWQIGSAPDFTKAVYHKFPGTRSTEYVYLEGHPTPGFNGWLDLDRDGIDDYCRISGTGSGYSSLVEIMCYVNGGDGNFVSSFKIDEELYGTKLDESDSFSGRYNWNVDPSWLDMNGDGFIDLCFSRTYASKDQIQCLLNNGSPNNPFSQKITADLNRPVDKYDVANRTWVDINGDTKIDYCYTYLNSDNKYLRCAIQDVNGFSFSPNVFTKKVSSLGGSWVDVSGDGLPDFCFLEKSKITCHINDEGKSVSAAKWSKTSSNIKFTEKTNWPYYGLTTKWFSARFFDFTGNGFNDYCRIYKSSDGYRAKCLESRGNGWGDEVVSGLIPNPTDNYEEEAEATLFIDINNDGYMDWCVENGAQVNVEKSELSCFLSSSSGFGKEISTYSLPHLGGVAALRNQREVNRGQADIDGDGVGEYCALYFKSLHPVNDRGIACYGAHQNIPSDLLVGAVNGFGLEYQASYSDISDENIYSYSAQPGEYGQVSLTGGLNVVSEFKVSNGVGGEHIQEYFYSNYAYDPNGYGGMGFEYVQVLSEGGNKRAKTLFSQNLFDHTAGQPTESKVSYKVGSDFVVASATENDWETVIYNDGDYSVSPAANIFDQNEQSLRFSVRLRESISEQNELDGSQVSSTTTTSIYSDYGDLEDQTIVTDGASQSFTKHIDTTFYPPDFSSWILGRQKRTTVSTWGDYQGQAASAVTRTSSWEYYPSGSLFEGMILKEVIEPDSAEFRKEKVYTYTDFGLKESVTEKHNGLPDRVTTYGYDTTGRFLETVANALGHTVTNHFDPVTGNKTESIDANGLVSTFEYDRTGRPEASFSSTGQSQQTRYKDCAMVSDCPANAVWFTEQWAENALGSKMSGLVKAYKDVLGRDIEVRTETFDGTVAVVRTVYGADGEVKKVSEPFFKGASPTAWNEIVSRDELKRPTQEQNAAGLTTITEYLGLTTRKTLSWQNPIAGEGGTVTQVANSTEDVLGNLRSATDPDYRTISYQYDGANQLKVVTLPDNLTLTNSYDLLGRKTASSDPNMGNWKYAYNGDDQLVLQENGSGKRTCIAYDSLGRKIAVADDYQPSASWSSALVSAKNGCSGKMATASWQFDVQGKGVGRLAWVEHANGYRNEVFYDNYGRVESTETEYDGFTVVSSKTYDSATGRVKQATLPHRSSGPSVDIEYRYNSLGHLYEVGEAGDPSQYYWRVESKTVRGQINETYRANGMIRGHYNFDANSGVLSQIRAKSIIHAGWNIQDNHYVHNAKGLMRKRTDSLQQIEELFTYDALDRLDMASVVHQSDPALSYNQDPDYDISGNITQRNDVGTYHYDESCEHLGQPYTPGPYAVTEVSGARNASYCYDNGGNMLSGDGKNITYNAFNKPTKIQSATAAVDMVYGPGRGLIKHTTTASGKILTKHSFGGYENIEINESGQLTRKERFTLPGGVVISYEDGDPATRKEEYLFNDALGSVVAVTDGLAQVTEQYRYDPWGRPRLANWQALTDSTWENLGREEGATGKGFTGHQMLDEVGVIHMGGRIYDPTLGRFMSADPVVKGLTNVESYNRYSYVLNSPMSFTDPSGYSWWSENVTDKLRDLRKKYKREILGVMTLGTSESIRFASEELARFAAKNKYAGEVIGVVGIAACSYFTAGAGTAACAGAFQGTVTTSIALENGASFNDALQAGVKSGAIAYVSASMAYEIEMSGISGFEKGFAHGVRGALTASASGGDAVSGFAGGFAVGSLGDGIQKITGSSQAGGALASALLGGTASEISGGKFVVGAATGAFSYLARQMAVSAKNGDGPLRGLYKKITSSHFEGRDARNAKFESLSMDEVENAEGWTEMTGVQASAHQDNIPGVERKFIHVSGGELVFSGRDGSLITDPAYKGTYNYINGVPWEDVNSAGSFSAFIFKGAGHMVVDYVPWLMGGNIRGVE